MTFSTFVKDAVHHVGWHPRRWFDGFVSYPRYLGYIRPHLLAISGSEYVIRRRLLATAWKARRLEAPVGNRILVLCPHPDDESIGPGGLLLAHRNMAEIHLVCVCDGSGGGALADATADAKDLVIARRGEFQKAAIAFGAASVTHLDYPDGNVPLSAESVANLRSTVVAVNPDVVLLPWLLDEHVDHRATNALYARACANMDALVLGYEIWSMLEPNAFFDITEVLEEKIAIIGYYESQLRTVDYIAYCSGLARVRAFQISDHPLRSGAVEAFVALPNREYCELVDTLRAA